MGYPANYRIGMHIDKILILHPLFARASTYIMRMPRILRGRVP